jgi:hypothetical protein
MTYGIPHDALPVTSEGGIKVKNHLDWIKIKIRREQCAKEGMTDTVELPSREDFLIGRGKPTQFHAGNMRLHVIVDECLPQYEGANRKEKTEISAEAVSQVKAYLGRFLSQKSGVWIQVADEVAREKVSQLFRSRRKLKPKVTTTQTKKSTGIRVDTATSSAVEVGLGKRPRFL